MPLKPAASSLADTPSTMKLLERLRWLAIEMPWPGNGRRFRKELRAADVGRRHAGNEQREIEEIPPVHRQALNLGLRHGTGDLRSCRLDNRGVPTDVHAFLESGERHGERKVECGSNREVEHPGEIGKPLNPNYEFARADLQIRKAEAPGRVGHRLGGDIRGRLTSADVSARDHSTLRIGDTTADAGIVNRLLGEHRVRARQRSTQQCHQFPPHGNTSSRKNGTTQTRALVVRRARKRIRLRARGRSVGRFELWDQLISGGGDGTGGWEINRRSDGIGQHAVGRQQCKKSSCWAAAGASKRTVMRRRWRRLRWLLLLHAIVMMLHRRSGFALGRHRSLLGCLLVAIRQHRHLMCQTAGPRHERRQRRGLEKDPRYRERAKVSAKQCHYNLISLTNRRVPGNWTQHSLQVQPHNSCHRPKAVFSPKPAHHRALPCASRKRFTRSVHFPRARATRSRSAP